MVKSLEQFVAEATQAYQPAQTAIQNQLNSLSGQLDTANEQINRNYAQQQAGLNRQRNMAAETASMQAAGSGGSFGGAANIANRKYYDQTFVPAVTQMRTNQANELAQARQNIENQRTNLNSQAANLESQANQQALAQYWAEVEAEKNRAAQLAAAREANAANQYLMDAIRAGQSGGNAKNSTDFLGWIKNYSGWNSNDKNYWINNINKIASQGGLAGQALQSALANRLQNTSAYKQYLRWRNS